jgi:hypothetical protein
MIAAEADGVQKPGKDGAEAAGERDRYNPGGCF